jgi:hypothetical protein
MNLTRTKILFFTAIVALLVSIPAVVSAQDIPHFFAGNAYIDNSLAPGNTTVEAYINGNRVGDIARTNASGFYVLPVPPASGGQPSHSGQTVTFKVRGLDATETAVWAPAGSNTSFNLNASTTAARPTNTPRPTAAPRLTQTRPTNTPRPAFAGPGPTGRPGATGQTGATGEPGATGIPGATGRTGGPGLPGATGLPGSAGDAGDRGDRGPQGYVGQQGGQGVAGPTGATGVQGPSGPPGSSGNFLIAIIALIVALLALLVAIGRWIWELQSG